jgi:hypothetical protein
MYKALCAVVLLVPTFFLAQDSKPVGASSFPSPLVVAKSKLVNQTATIPTTTIFTPLQDGLYRLTVYATLSKTDPSSQSLWFYNFAWNDDAGPHSVAAMLYQFGNTAGPFLCQFTLANQGTTFPFQAKAGMPVTYSVTQANGTDNSAYSLYYTLERLE